MKNYFDIAGDGGSDVLAQIAAEEAVRQSLAGVKHRMAIGSGKGGVGKSTVTLQLAETLGARGHRVAILDADLNGPSQARLAGVGLRPLVPGVTGLALPRNSRGIGVVSLGSLVPESEAVSFASVSTGDSHVWRATREFAFLGQLLAGVSWGTLDFLLVDLPPGAERTFQYAEFLGPETGFVLVTLPSALSFGVVARSLAALRGAPNRVLGYIENMKGYYCAACDDVRPLFPESGKEGLELARLGSVPFDPELAALGDRGGSVTERPESAVASAFREIADRLVEEVKGGVKGMEGKA